MGLVRRIVTFALVVAVSFVGIPLPAYAAVEESPPLTFHGRRLSELFHGRATGAPFLLPALVHQDGGGDVGRIGKLGVDPLANGALLAAGIGGGLGLAVSTANAEMAMPPRLVIPVGATNPALLTAATNVQSRAAK